MRLNNPLVTSFLYEGKEYEIDLTFDNVLDVYEVFEDEDLRDYEKAEIAVTLLVDDYSKEVDAVDLWNFINKSFIQKERKQLIEYDRKGNPMPLRDEENEVTIDYNKDAEFIYASFMQAYQIDLYEYQGKMHWLKFKALLNGLPADTVMQKIINIRSWKPAKHETAEFQQSMKKLQKIYAINDVEEVE